jgi:hypothetical protein
MPLEVAIKEVFRCEEHLYKRLRRSVGRLVGWSVRWSVPTMQLRGKLVTSRLIREEGEEEKNWLRGKLVTSRLIREEGRKRKTGYVAIPSHLGIR